MAVMVGAGVVVVSANATPPMPQKEAFGKQIQTLQLHSGSLPGTERFAGTILRSSDDPALPVPSAQAFAGADTAKNADNRPATSQTYVIYDERNDASFVLDNAGQAAKFEGKQVEVIGKLDETNNTIHVQYMSVISRLRSFAVAGK